MLAIMFKWGIALQGRSRSRSAPRRATTNPRSPEPWVTQGGAAGRQGLLDLSGAESSAMAPRITAERGPPIMLRNVWAYVGDLLWPPSATVHRNSHPPHWRTSPKSEWYLRQMLGTANFHAGPMLAFLSGNLCYQIEHHLFPDLPSNRYAQISSTGSVHMRPL